MNLVIYAVVIIAIGVILHEERKHTGHLSPPEIEKMRQKIKDFFKKTKK